MRRVSIALVLLTLMFAQPAHADQIDINVGQLKNGKSVKIRLSAALALAKTRDNRSVKALVYALEKDSESTVRRVAAVSLGKIVDASTPKKLQKKALKALKNAKKNDSDSKVRKNAAKALKKLASLSSVTSPTVFVNIGDAADLSGKLTKTSVKEIKKVLEQTVRSEAPKYSTKWHTGKLPTKKQLEKANTSGFYVGATVSTLEVKKKSGRVEIKCTVSVRVNPWNGRDTKEKWEARKAASASGSGKVIGSNSKRGIRNAKEDCVLAVLEEVTASQVVPFIKKTAP
jgi:uncharacterized protein (UPF0147 family)